jgi:ArsR family transcriptional regulator
MRTNGGTMVDWLRAAGEPTRLRVLALLSQEELAVIELGGILQQSQPRVSRHLKLLTEAGLVERFPDGAWVFHRLSAAEPVRGFLEGVLALVDLDAAPFAADCASLDRVRAEREAHAAAYFARNAAQWDEIRSLHVDEAEVEAAILRAAGPGPFHRLVDLGTGAGRMLTLLGPLAEHAVGLDLSQSMLNIARGAVAKAGCDARFELRHGDIFATGLPGASADLVVIHRVLHYLADPAGALEEAARLLRPGGKLLVIDFAPHALEQLRDQHQHRRLGFSDEEMDRALAGAGLDPASPLALPPAAPGGLTVKIWSATSAPQAQRSAA